jgi:electron transport complex protein RnfD
MNKNYRDLTIAPFSFLTPSITNISTAMLILLVPQVLLLILTKSFTSIILIAVSIISSVLAEFTSNKIRHTNTLFDLTAIVQGLFIGMFIPQTYPIIPVFFIVYLSLLMIKYIFGGNAESWINPTAYTVIIIYFLGISFFPELLITKNYLESGNPGLQLIQNGDIPVLKFDSSITFWLNTHFFSHLGIEIPTGYLSMFWDTQSVIPAFRFNLLTLFSSMFLISVGIINWIVPTAFLAVYGILVRLFSQTLFTGIVGQGDLLLALLTSGTLFTAFFIVDFYGTTPITNLGKLLYGIVVGIIAFFITGCGTSPIGSMFTVLFANVVSPIIQLLEDKIYSVWVSKTIRNNNYA